MLPCNVSVLILTLNEEINLPKCLASVAWCDDIVVVDSFSTDKTVSIAEKFGARVVQRKLISWSEHQNWINQNISFKHKWVYYSDADEVVTDDLRHEIMEIASGVSSYAAYRVRYKNFFLGKWLRFSGGYPIWVLRFFQPDAVRWERLVNPRPVVNGDIGRLSSHFHHYSFNKGFDSWFEKHNKYSRDEAIESLRSLRSGDWRFFDLFSFDSARRRASLKELSFRLPARGIFRFIYLYFLKLGFLDGAPGLHWSVLMSYYEYMIELKVMELMRRESDDVI
jgi:glycosyltransferase involved in cell wall biosynthesis